jgi:hypothetical protein
MVVSFAFLFLPPILCFRMLRHLLALAFLGFMASAQATCLFARDSKPHEWYEWANVLFAADVTGVEAKGRLDLVALRVVETFKGPAGADTATLQVPNNLWEACRLERPAVGERVLGAVNANNDALVVPLSASFADQMRAARSGPAIPIASQLVTPPAAPTPAAAPIAARCVETPVYGATVKVENCEPAESGALFLRGEVLRVARENSAREVPGLPVPAAGQRYLFYKSTGQCRDFGKNPALTGSLSHPCCDSNYAYCTRRADFLIDDGAAALTSK